MPLIDVVFLLITFFLYAMVLMVRADFLPVELPTLSEARPGADVEAISITVDEAGLVYVDGEATEIAGVVERVRQALEETPNARVYLAAAQEGSTDRLPVFIDLVNELRGSGLSRLYIVGRPKEER